MTAVATTRVEDRPTCTESRNIATRMTENSLSANDFDHPFSKLAPIASGDIEAARRIELDLPQTGVCSSSWVLPSDGIAEAACCTPETPQGICCAPKLELSVDAPCCGTAAGKETAIVEPAE